jgi:hypothetical protein
MSRGILRFLSRHFRFSNIHFFSGITGSMSNHFPDNGTSRYHIHNFMETGCREKAHIPLKRRTLATDLAPGYGIAVVSVATGVPAPPVWIQ